MELVESAMAKERDKGVELMKKLLVMELAAKTRAQEAASRALADKELKEYEEELSLNSMDAYRL